MDTPTSATMLDASRSAATGGDLDYSLSIEEVSQLYANAGHARTIRTLQRYCVSGHLEAQKVATTLGDKYLVTPQSVARHIAQIRELSALDNAATGRDQPRLVATPVGEQLSHDSQTTPGDEGRQTATGETGVSRYVEQLEKRIDEKDDVIGLLRGQLVAKDDQISELSTRYRETHSLLGAMQRMLAPLLGQSDPYVTPEKREVREPVDNSTTINDRAGL